MATVYTYKTLEACIAAFHSCEEDEIHAQGPWVWNNEGKRTVWNMRRMIRIRKKTGAWGFCREKGDIYVWIAPHATPLQIIRLLAHELGHKQRPFKRDRIAEEIKADRYEAVAGEAYELMELLKDYYAKENTSEEV